MGEWRVVKLHGPFDGDLSSRLTKQLLEDIRPCDLRDVSFTTASPELLISMSIENSEELAVARDKNNNLLFVAGVGFNRGEQIGRTVWMLGTNKVYNYKKSLLVEFCQRQCREWVRKYKLLTEAVHPENLTSIQWLQRVLGAVFLDDEWELNGVKLRKCFIVERGND